MKKFTAVFIFLFLLGASVSAQFEGSITFSKSTASDTVRYTYYIKGDNVRIDEIGSKSDKVEGSFLLNTKTSEMKFLSHDRKTWGKHQSSGTATAVSGATVTQTKNKKTIQGYSCTEWVVKTDAAEISYWVATGKFNFFLPMLKLINRKEKFSTYYLSVNAKAGSFPFLAVQKESGKETGRLEVTKIEKKTLETSVFEIPKDYKEFK